MQVIRSLYDWLGTKIYSKNANSSLAFFFFLDAIIFFPAEALLALFCLERRDYAYRYAAIATAASVVGGVVSYFMGWALWAYFGQTIINSTPVGYIMTPETAAYLCAEFKQHEWATILLIGFTPVPFKAVTTVAGFCQVALLPFIVCAAIVRGARFYLIAWVLTLWGKQMKEYIDRYFTLFVLCILFIAGVAMLLLK